MSESIDKEIKIIFRGREKNGFRKIKINGSIFLINKMT